jgi:hypothetical protein
MFQGLVLLSPEELAFTEQARAMEEQYRAHVEEQRNRAFHRLEEMFKLKPELGHPIFRQVSKTLQVWLRVTDIRRVDVAKVFLRKWGVRFEYRHATYQYKVLNSIGMASKRNVQRCPPLFGIRIAWSLVGQLQDRLRDAGVNTVVSGIKPPPFLGVKIGYNSLYHTSGATRVRGGGRQPSERVRCP